MLFIHFYYLFPVHLLHLVPYVYYFAYIFLLYLFFLVCVNKLNVYLLIKCKHCWCLLFLWCWISGDYLKYFLIDRNSNYILKLLWLLPPLLLFANITSFKKKRGGGSLRNLELSLLLYSMWAGLLRVGWLIFLLSISQMVHVVYRSALHWDLWRIIHQLVILEFGGEI